MANDLDQAYALCEQITRAQAGNFYYAFRTLPARQRRAIYAAYAFCRRCDDIADDDLPIEAKQRLLAETRNLLADGQLREMSFELKITKSSWIALRILPSSHTNPIFALVDSKPIRASRRSAQWCLAAVDQCWSQKAPRIRASEREDARKAYDHARRVYRERIAESSP